MKNLLTKIRALLAPYRKTLAAAIVSALVAVAAHVGLSLDAGMVAALTTVVTTIAVYLIPNTETPAP